MRVSLIHENSLKNENSYSTIKERDGKGGKYMKLKNIRLTLANVNTTTNRKDMEAVETSINRVRLDDGTLGKDVESYSVHCLAYRGDFSTFVNVISHDGRAA